VRIRDPESFRDRVPARAYLIIRAGSGVKCQSYGWGLFVRQRRGQPAFILYSSGEVLGWNGHKAHLLLRSIFIPNCSATAVISTLFLICVISIAHICTNFPLKLFFYYLNNQRYSHW
jgi:hypothetical protein